MEKIVLKAEVRKEAGKRVAKDLRKEKLIPAIVYKSGNEALMLQLSRDDIMAALHTKAGENVIITLDITGEGSVKPKTVLIKEVQHEPIKNEILHIDFNEISLTDTLKVNVPLASRGEAIGVQRDGGVLDHVIWELHIECLPTAIPEKIDVDISNLVIGQPIHVKDIVVPEGVKVLNDPELIAFIVKTAKVEVPVVEGLSEAPAEPELIRKKKEEDSEEEAGKAPKDAKEAKEGAKESK